MDANRARPEADWSRRPHRTPLAAGWPFSRCPFYDHPEEWAAGEPNDRGYLFSLLPTSQVLTVVDAYGREHLALDAERRADTMSVLERLASLFLARGVPDYLRSDKGAEFTARKVWNWLARTRVKTLFIAPGSPWENG